MCGVVWWQDLVYVNELLDTGGKASWDFEVQEEQDLMVNTFPAG